MPTPLPPVPPLPPPSALPALPLTKVCDPTDLVASRRHVAHVWTTRPGPLAFEAAALPVTRLPPSQHPLRQWEYAMALHAVRTWVAERDVAAPAATGSHTYPRRLLDVGGAASPFVTVIDEVCPGRFVAQVIDPAVNTTLEAAPILPGTVDVIIALSLLEHIPQPKTFLRACTTLLAPGGLLVLTVDYWDCDGPDVAREHDTRKRIYNRHSLMDLLTFARESLGVRRYHDADLAYHGNVVWDHSVASVALQKTPLAPPVPPATDAPEEAPCPATT